TDPHHRSITIRAEREGFEPSVQENPIRRFSKPVTSATQPSLQWPAKAHKKTPGLAKRTNRAGAPKGKSKRGAPCPGPLRDTIRLPSQPAEEEGFEPPELALGGFQDRCLRPLGHSSRRSQR